MIKKTSFDLNEAVNIVLSKQLVDPAKNIMHIKADHPLYTFAQGALSASYVFDTQVFVLGYDDPFNPTILQLYLYDGLRNSISLFAETTTTSQFGLPALLKNPIKDTELFIHVVDNINNTTVIRSYDWITRESKDVNTIPGTSYRHLINFDTRMLFAALDDPTFVLVYNLEDNTFQKIGSLSSVPWLLQRPQGFGYVSAVYKVGNKIILFKDTPNKCVVYDSDINTVSEITGVFTANQTMANKAGYVVGTSLLFILASSGGKFGVFDSTTNTLFEIGTVSNAAWGWGSNSRDESVCVVNTKAVLAKGNTSGILGAPDTSTTIVVFNSATNTVSEIGTLAAATWGWRGMAAVSTKVVLGRGDTAGTNIAVYDSVAHTVTALSGSPTALPSVAWRQPTKVGTKVVLGRWNTTAGTNIAVYDSVTNTVTALSGSPTALVSAAWAPADIIGTKLTLYSGDSRAFLVVYDSVANTITVFPGNPTPITAGYWCSDSSIIINHLLIARSGGSAKDGSLVVYDSLRHTASGIQRIPAFDKAWRFMKVVGNRVFLQVDDNEGALGILYGNYIPV